MRKEETILSVDWGHKLSNVAIFDGNECHNINKDDVVTKLIKLGASAILVENIPVYMAKKIRDKEIDILTCHTMSSREQRERMGIPRKKFYNNDGHSDDALVIHTLYQECPDQFYFWKPNEMKLSYSSFIQVQKTRVAVENRNWSLEAKEQDSELKKYLEKAEKELEKKMDKLGENDIIYQYLKNIIYIGPRTAGGVRGLLDPTRFDTASKMRRYAGLAIIDGKIQKLSSGESAGYTPEAKALLLYIIAGNFIKTKSTEKNLARGKKPAPYLSDYTKEYDHLQNKLFTVPLKPESIVGDILAEDVDGFKKGERIYKTKKRNVRHLIATLESQGKESVKMFFSDGHIHARSIRKMMSKFLEDYWCIGRQLEGFPTVAPYPIDVLNHSHYRLPHYIPDMLKPFEPERPFGWVFIQGKRPIEEASPYIKKKLKELGHEQIKS